MRKGKAIGIRRALSTGLLGLLVVASACGGADTAASTAAPSTTTTAATAVTEPSTSSPTPVLEGLSCPEPGELPSEVDFSAKWAVGTVVELSVHQTRIQNGSETGASTTPVILEVLGHDDDGYSLSWTYGATLLESAIPADLDSDLVDELTALASFTIEYRTDEFGVFEDVTNVEALQTQFNRILQFFDDNVFAGMDPQTVAATRGLLAAMSSDDQIGATLAEDVITYHGAYGYIVEAAVPLTFPTELPNALGGDPFPGTQTVALLENSDGCIPLQITITPEPTRFREILGALIAGIAEQQGATVEDIETELGAFTIENSILFVWDPESTWFVDVDATQAISTGSTSRTDTTRFEIGSVRQ